MSNPKKARQPGFLKVGECLYRHETSGTYYALVKSNGKQIRRSLKTQDLPLAKRRLREFREKIGRLDLTDGKSKLLFPELAEKWRATLAPHLKPSSALRRDSSIVQLNRFFGQQLARTVTRTLCEDWAQARSPQVAASTFNNERDTLIAIFEYARREGIVLDNPAEVLPRRKQPKPAILIPTREQYEGLLKTMRGMDNRYWTAADLVELLATSGMRKGEANALHWEDIDWNRGAFTVTGGEGGTKNHEARIVPLFPALKEFLSRKLAEYGDIPPTPESAIVPVKDTKKALETVCQHNGYPHFTHHCLRHFFVSNAIEKNVDFKTIATWVGHKDGGILVARTYGHLRDTHSFEMAKRMV